MIENNTPAPTNVAFFTDRDIGNMEADIRSLKEEIGKNRAKIDALQSWKDKVTGAAWSVGVLWTVLTVGIPLLVNYLQKGS